QCSAATADINDAAHAVEFACRRDRVTHLLGARLHGGIEDRRLCRILGQLLPARHPEYVLEGRLARVQGMHQSAERFVTLAGEHQGWAAEGPRQIAVTLRNRRCCEAAVLSFDEDYGGCT